MIKIAIKLKKTQINGMTIHVHYLNNQYDTGHNFNHIGL